MLVGSATPPLAAFTAPLPAPPAARAAGLAQELGPEHTRVQVALREYDRCVKEQDRRFLCTDMG